MRTRWTSLRVLHGGWPVATAPAGPRILLLAALMCLPSHSVAQQLAAKHGEVVVGDALYMPSGAWRLLFAQRGAVLPEHHRTWTVVDVIGGMACVVAAGVGLTEAITDVMAGRGEALPRRSTATVGERAPTGSVRRLHALIEVPIVVTPVIAAG
jgi:hypothetical protein